MGVSKGDFRREMEWIKVFDPFHFTSAIPLKTKASWREKGTPELQFTYHPMNSAPLVGAGTDLKGRIRIARIVCASRRRGSGVLLAGMIPENPCPPEDFMEPNIFFAVVFYFRLSGSKRG